MQILTRRIGEHRGAPRLYLDSHSLALAGFAPGCAISIQSHVAELRLVIRLDVQGQRRVSKKRRRGREFSVIDINARDDLAPFEAGTVLRIVVAVGVVHVLLPASVGNAKERLRRISAKLTSGQALSAAGVFFGAGIASGALHAGMSAGGVPVELALANEISDTYAELAMAANPVVRPSTLLVQTPVQELAQDEWMLRRTGHVDILEAGIPCSGASRAGVAKRRLAKMEDHPLVGHLIGAFIQVLGRLQPAVVVIENVESYRDTASAAILRGWLRDAGYGIEETVLNAADFGSLEARVRWFLVAHPPEIRLSLVALTGLQEMQPILADYLDEIGPNDERFRTVDYLKRKQQLDEDQGKHFGMQIVTGGSTRVPVLRKGYHKGGSTDPRLLHPSDPERSRLLTAAEHARIKAIDPAMVAGVAEIVGHQVCGQAVDARPVRAIGKRIAEALTASVRQGGASRGDLTNDEGLRQRIQRVAA